VSEREPGVAPGVGVPLRQRLAYLAYASIAWLGRTLPTTTGRVLFRWAGIAAYHLLPRRRAIVAANQAQVLGRPVDDPFVRDSTREAFRRYARYWFDGFDVATWTEERLRRAVAFEGLDHPHGALAEGKGLIAVAPHAGNWDAAGRGLAIEGLPVVAVAERLRPDALYRLFVAHREALGMQILALDEEGLARRLAEILRANGIVALVADRDLTGRGVEVEMFGGTRRLPTGPALLALQTGAPIMVAALAETPTGWRVVLHRPFTVEPSGDRRADVRATMQRIADMFERDIAASPADWHLFQPGWDP